MTLRGLFCGGGASRERFSIRFWGVFGFFVMGFFAAHFRELPHLGSTFFGSRAFQGRAFGSRAFRERLGPDFQRYSLLWIVIVAEAFAQPSRFPAGSAASAPSSQATRCSANPFASTGDALLAL